MVRTYQAEVTKAGKNLGECYFCYYVYRYGVQNEVTAVPSVNSIDDIACPCGNSCKWVHLKYENDKPSNTQKYLSECSRYLLEETVNSHSHIRDESLVALPNSDDTKVTVFIVEDVSPDVMEAKKQHDMWLRYRPSEELNVDYYKQLLEWYKSEPPEHESKRTIVGAINLLPLSE